MKTITTSIVFAALLWVACKNPTPKRITDDDLTVAEFLAVAPALKLPAIIHDSTVARKESDTLLLKTTNFRRFVPDTTFQRLFVSEKNLRLYVLGKIKDNNQGYYVVIKSVQGNKKKAWLLYFNDKMQFIAGKQIGDNQHPQQVKRYCKIDNRFNITIAEETRQEGEQRLKETIYYLDPSGIFILVMTNSNEDLSAEIRGNPIDTLPRKHKYAADYVLNSKNMVSIRDGATPKTMQFFIHFSKLNDECVGELKGEATWIAKDKAVFRDVNSPCVIHFTFTNNAVRIQEENGCGMYRDIKCFFEGSYPRKKTTTKKSRK